MARISPATLLFAILLVFALPAAAQVNQPPTLVAPTEFQRDPGQTLLFNINTSDPDGDVVTLEAANVPAGATFRLDGNGNGFFFWVPAAEDEGFYTVTLIATDDGTPVLSTTGEVAITIGDPNLPPVLAPIGDQDALVGNLLMFPLDAADPDADPLAFSASPGVAGSVIRDNGDGTGSFEYTPTAADVGNHGVTFIVSDGFDTDEETIVISVGEVNVPPVLQPIGNRQSELGTPIEIALMAADPDGDALVFTVDGLPEGLSLTDRGDGTGQISGTPVAAGVYEMTVTVTDDGVPPEAALETFELDVREPPAAPALLMVRARWHRHQLKVAGEGAVPGAEVEIRDAMTDMSLGHLTAASDGSFTGMLRPFVPPCSVQAHAGEIASGAIEVADAPAQCSESPRTQVLVALWSCHRGLYVAGRRAPPHATVRVYDTTSEELLAMTTARRRGHFLLRGASDESPESVTVSIEDGGVEWMLDPTPVRSKGHCHRHRHHGKSKHQKHRSRRGR